MKKLIYFIIIYFLLFSNKVFAWSIKDIIKDDNLKSEGDHGVILSNFKSIIGRTTYGYGSGNEIVDGTVNTIIDYAFIILPAVAIGAFVYAGYLLITSQGNPDELKKAWHIFTYTLIGVTVAYLAYLAVRLVLNISF